MLSSSSQYPGNSTIKTFTNAEKTEEEECTMKGMMVSSP